MALMNLIFMAEVILSQYMQLRNQKLHLRMTITINKVNVQRYQMLVSDKKLLETVQTLIRLLPQEQSDQGLHCFLSW